MFNINFCQWLDSNLGPLELELTIPLTEPQSLWQNWLRELLLTLNICCSNPTATCVTRFGKISPLWSLEFLAILMLYLVFYKKFSQPTLSINFYKANFHFL